MAVNPVTLLAAVALSALSMALAPPIEGPRVTDLKTTVADYGTPLNYVYGTRRVACPCFYAEPLKEVYHRRKTKGAKFNDYTYFGTWTAHVADHPIGSVRRIWFDGHLIYDIEATDPLYPLADDYELANHIRIYTGSSDQEPDPRMLATREAEHGAGSCPAYRGQAYIFFEDIPLEKIFNRLPQVTVETNAELIPLVSIDFKNGIYSILGESKSLTEVVDNQIGGIFDPDNVIPGVGLRATSSSMGGYNAVATLTAEATAALGLDDFTSVVDFSVVASGTAATAQVLMQTGYGSPTFNTGNGFIAARDSAVSAANKAVITEGSITELAEVINPLPSGTHRIAMTSRPAELGSAIDCGTSVTAVPTALPSPVTKIALESYAYVVSTGSATATIEKAVFYAGRDPSALGILSCADVGTSTATLGSILADLSARGGMVPGDYDYSLLDQPVPGYSWTQGTPKQIAGPLLDVYDSVIRPHDFGLQGIKRGGTSLGTLSSAEMVAAEPRFAIPMTADSDLPHRLFFTFADIDADQNPNSAVAQRRDGASASARETSVDLSRLALTASEAKQFADRYHRGVWFRRAMPEFALTRQRLALEVGDLWTPEFDGDAMTARCTRMELGANGVIQCHWEQESAVAPAIDANTPGVPDAADPEALTGLSGAAGAAAAGYVPSAMLDPAPSEGAVLDLPLLRDSQEQATPFALVVAGPVGPKVWTGAQFSQSDSGEDDSFAMGWDAVNSTLPSVIGVTTGALPAVVPGNFDAGSSLEVTVNSGTLTAATQDALLLNGDLNLAAVESAAGWELVQFTTPTLTAPGVYTLTGFHRGLRGTEQHIAGHAAGDRFILLNNAKVHTLGAGEIGDTDSYIVSTVGRNPAVADKFALPFTAAAQRPYAPVQGAAVLAGGDWSITATRRTRIGGTTLNGQDVPLGEASESWSLDILDGPDVVRTITGTALPLTYTAAMQTADFGGAVGLGDFSADLHQVNPTLNLRGFPLRITG